MYTTSAVLFLIGITSLTNGAQMVRKTSMKRRIARDKASLIRNGGVILVQANDVLETAQRCAVDNIQPCLNALQAISTEHVIAYEAQKPVAVLVHVSINGQEYLLPFKRESSSWWSVATFLYTHSLPVSAESVNAVLEFSLSTFVDVMSPRDDKANLGGTLTLPDMCNSRSHGTLVSLNTFASSKSVSEDPARSTRCSPPSILERLLGSRSQVAVDRRNVSSILDFLCGPRLGEFVDVVHNAPGAFRKHAGRLVLWITDHRSGGPEAWVQLWQLLIVQGFNVSVLITTKPMYPPTSEWPWLSNVHPEHAAYYNVTPNLVASLEDLGPGDILLSRSDILEQFCDHVFRFRSKGVRVYFWLLGMNWFDAHSMHPNCSSIIAHSQQTRAGRVSEHAVIHPYVANRNGFGTYCPGLVSEEFPIIESTVRTRRVLFDGDSFYQEDVLVPVLNNMSDKLVLDVQALVVQNLTQREVYAYLSDSTVVTDRHIPGLERLPMEGVLCGNVLVIDDLGGGAFPEDFSLPPALVFPASDLGAAGETLAIALECYSDFQPLMAPMFHKIINFKSSMPGEVGRLFFNDFHFVIPLCADSDGTAAIAFAFSVLAVLPFSTVEILVDDEAGFRSVHSTAFKILQDHFVQWSLVLTRWQVPERSMESAFSHPLHAIATGRLLVFTCEGDVFVGKDMGRRASVATMLRSGPKPVNFSSPRAFIVVDSLQATCIARDIKRCVPILNDPSDELGIRVRGLLTASDAAGMMPAQQRGLSFLCRQPLWRGIQQALGGPFTSLCTEQTQ